MVLFEKGIQQAGCEYQESFWHKKAKLDGFFGMPDKKTYKFKALD